MRFFGLLLRFRRRLCGSDRLRVRLRLRFQFRFRVRVRLSGERLRNELPGRHCDRFRLSRCGLRLGRCGLRLGRCGLRLGRCRPGNKLGFRFGLCLGFRNRLHDGFRFHDGFRLHNRLRLCDGFGVHYGPGFRNRLFGGRFRGFRFRLRFLLPGERIERKHVAQVDDLRDGRVLLPGGSLRNGFRCAETHLIVDRTQLFERQIAFEGWNVVRLHPPFDEFRKLLQFALYRFQIHSSIQFRPPKIRISEGNVKFI